MSPEPGEILVYTVDGITEGACGSHGQVKLTPTLKDGTVFMVWQRRKWLRVVGWQAGVCNCAALHPTPQYSRNEGSQALSED
jgi:hypothetical protein